MTAREAELYRPCGECHADCERWADGNPHGCAGETVACGEIEEEPGGWRWVHGCEAHKYDLA